MLTADMSTHWMMVPVPVSILCHISKSGLLCGRLIKVANIDRAAFIFKAAITNRFILTVDQMPTCMWKGSLTVMNPQTLISWICSSPQLYEAFQRIQASCFLVLNSTVLCTLTSPSALFLELRQAAVFRKKADKVTVHDLLGVKQQKDKVSN